MANHLDEELKKAFGELQEKMQDTSKKISVIDSQIGMIGRVYKLVNLTHQEINNLPPDTKTYESVGRMFMLTDLGEVKNNLNERLQHMTSRTKELESNKEYLEKSLKESGDNIREMLQQRKELSEMKQ